MTLWAILPVKPLRSGKSRLSKVLSEEERAALNQNLLQNSLKVLASLELIDTILVVSRDPAVLTIARDYGAKTVLENGNPELNTALKRASLVAQTYLAQEIMVIPADLPLLSKEDLTTFLSHAGKPPEVLIAPDRRKDGTNCLYINPAGLIQFSYGPGSFQKHIDLGKKVNARTEIIEMESLGLDLDLPEDLEILKSVTQKSSNF
jgi:2-phospho-L-lactate/phosphoenolpyruvate guanylyltransferase